MPLRCVVLTRQILNDGKPIVETLNETLIPGRYGIVSYYCAAHNQPIKIPCLECVTKE